MYVLAWVGKLSVSWTLLHHLSSLIFKDEKSTLFNMKNHQTQIFNIQLYLVWHSGKNKREESGTKLTFYTVGEMGRWIKRLCPTSEESRPPRLIVSMIELHQTKQFTLFSLIIIFLDFELGTIISVRPLTLIPPLSFSFLFSDAAFINDDVIDIFVANFFTLTQISFYRLTYVICYQSKPFFFPRWTKEYYIFKKTSIRHSFSEKTRVKKKKKKKKGRVSWERWRGRDW